MNPYARADSQARVAPAFVDLLQGGAAFFAALIQALDQAQQEVRLETYLFSFEGTGAEVAHALTRAAQRGVHVYVLVDAIGTGALPAVWAQRFSQAGVQWQAYIPLSMLGGLWGAWRPSRWRRLHRKLCVVDQCTAFCGGINILDDFHQAHAAQLLAQPRLDYAVCFNGPVALQVHETMVQLWARLEAVHQLRIPNLTRALDTWLTVEAESAPPVRIRGPLQLVLRDNLRHRTRIERSYRKALAQARHEVWIASAYFFPSWRLLRALTLAARRGVRVRLLLQGRYDYFFPYHASRQLYGQLLAAGVEIYEYHASALHAKVAVVDTAWATVGSSNLDPFSLLLAREANVVVRDAGFALTLQQSLAQAIEHGATRVEPQRFARRSPMQKGLDRLAAAVLRWGVLLTGKPY